MSTYRRLPVYLLLDCSESMAGEAIEQVSEGTDRMLLELRNNPYALETVWLSLVTFSSRAEQIVPLTELIQFRRPKLSVRTGTAMGGALRLLESCLRQEVRKTTQEQKGDYRPLVFLFTDGQPTDEWESAVAALQTSARPKAANIYAIACGPDVDLSVLSRITDIVLSMKDMSPESWQKTFVWLSASVETASKALDSGGEGGPIELPRLPADVLEVAQIPRDWKPGPARQVFLHATCSKTRRPYLMRFKLRPRDGRYEAVASHPLEAEDRDAGGALPPVNSKMLDGCPPCPHCGNRASILCECGVLGCFSGSRNEPYQCPGCLQRGMASIEGPGFDIRQSLG